MTSFSKHKEAKAFELNAARGVRDVVMFWLLRRLFLPITFFLGLCAVSAYAQSGFIIAAPAIGVLLIYVQCVYRFYSHNLLKNAPLPGAPKYSKNEVGYFGARRRNSNIDNIERRL